LIVLAGCDSAVREAAFAALAGRPASWFISNDAADVARLASTVPIVAAVVSDDGAGAVATSLCAALKQARPTPAVLYARRRGGLAAAGDALAAGADAFVDFADDGAARFGELLRALAEPTTGARPPVANGRAVALNPPTQSLVIDGRAVPLTACEYRLFAILHGRAGAIVSYDELQRDALGLVPSSDRRTLHVHVCHLRNKLGTAMTLDNRRGVGYRLLPPSLSPPAGRAGFEARPY
jgi:two-component system OmpR family response regulator